MALCLALLSAEHAELATLLGAWSPLPETVRARILGLVEGATAAGARG